MKLETGDSLLPRIGNRNRTISDMRIENQCTLKRKKERLFVSTETFEERKPGKKRKDCVQHENFYYIF